MTIHSSSYNDSDKNKSQRHRASRRAGKEGTKQTEIINVIPAKAAIQSMKKMVNL